MDDMLTKCEIYECYVMIENEFRANYCSNMGSAYCETPFVDCWECAGHKNCDGLYEEAHAMWAYYNTNSDFVINPNDIIDDE